MMKITWVELMNSQEIENIRFSVVKTHGRMKGLLHQPPNPQISVDPIEVQSPGRYCELVLDDQLCAGFEDGKFGEGIQGDGPV